VRLEPLSLPEVLCAYTDIDEQTITNPVKSIAKILFAFMAIKF
jgi:hypothetical protein